MTPKQTVLSTYPLATCEEENGMWFVMNGSRIIGFSVVSAAEAWV